MSFNIVNIAIRGETNCKATGMQRRLISNFFLNIRLRWATVEKIKNFQVFKAFLRCIQSAEALAVKQINSARCQIATIAPGTACRVSS